MVRDVKQQQLVSVKRPKAVEVYLVCPNLRSSNVSDLFVRISTEFPQLIENRPIFFSKQAALECGRFLEEDFGILQLYVPEAAVVGRASALHLKHQRISHEHIRGCYAGKNKSLRFYQYPDSLT